MRQQAPQLIAVSDDEVRRERARAVADLLVAHAAVDRLFERFERIETGELITVEEVEAVVAEHDRAVAVLGEWSVQ